MIGIDPGNHFLIRFPPAIEMITVDRLGSVILGASLVHNRPLGSHCGFVREYEGVLGPSESLDDGPWNYP